MIEYQTQSSQEMIDLGKKIALKFKPRDIILLYGELGAGKTTLTKGIAKGLQIEDEIISPTFTLMNVYTPKNQNSKLKNIAHIDTYRLKNEQELIEIGLKDYLGAEGTICIIEWPEKIKKLFTHKKTIDIVIKTQNKDKRRIIIR